MTFYHMWVNIDDYKEPYDSEDILKAAEDIGQIFGLKVEVIVNGTEVILATGNMNHFSSPVRNCIKFFEQLPRYLNIHSYGMLHVLDDENLELYDTFQVWTFKEGLVRRCLDNILSPVGDVE